MVANHSAISHVDRVFLEVTSRCNFDCSFCTNSSMHREPGLMAATTFKRIVDELATHHLTDMVLFHLMGEPLLHPEIMAFLQYAVERIPQQNLVTNMLSILSKAFKLLTVRFLRFVNTSQM